MRKRDTNVLSLLEDKTNDYARKTALGMKTSFGWRSWRSIKSLFRNFWYLIKNLIHFL